MAIWYIFWLFGIFCPALVCFMKKNLATLASIVQRSGLPAMRPDGETVAGKSSGISGPFNI
jgi:hypothetical protein